MAKRQLSKFESCELLHKQVATLYEHLEDNEPKKALSTLGIIRSILTVVNKDYIKQ